jgi:hypothetical protein
MSDRTFEEIKRDEQYREKQLAVQITALALDMRNKDAALGTGREIRDYAKMAIDCYDLIHKNLQ